MPRKNPASSMPLKEFFGDYADEISQAKARESRRTSMFEKVVAAKTGKQELFGLIDSARLWEELGNWWPIKLLKRAAKENDAEGFKRLLHLFLLEWGVRA